MGTKLHELKSKSWFAGDDISNWQIYGKGPYDPAQGTTRSSRSERGLMEACSPENGSTPGPQSPQRTS